MVRGEVARNPNCPIEVLDRLSKDKYWYVREKVAKNPNCPIDLLVQVMGDEDEDVRELAARSLRSCKVTVSPEERELIEAWETLMEIGVI